MADAIGLYYKTGGVESGGTNALTHLVTGGTRISLADLETGAFAFAALDTVYTLYYKSEDDSTFHDNGKETTAGFTITVPTGVQICTTYNGTFGSSASVVAATGAFHPVYVKQTARQLSSEADIEVGTGGVTFQTGIRVGQVGTVTPTTPAAGQVDLDWPDLSGADGYVIDYSTASNFATYTRTTSATSTKSITGLSNSTLYYFRVLGYDKEGSGAWSSTVSTTTLAPLVALSFVGAGAAHDEGGSISYATVSKPAGVQEGDFLLTLVCRTTAGEVTSGNTGWTNMGYMPGFGRWGYYYRVAGASEATETWNYALSGKTYARCYAFRGVDPNDPVDAYVKGTYQTSDATMKFGNVTASETYRHLVAAGVSYIDTTHTMSTSPFSDWVEDSDSGNTTTGCSGIVAHKSLWSGSGATGDVNATISAATVYKEGWLLALNPDIE